jgi:hypothetical protein
MCAQVAMVIIILPNIGVQKTKKRSRSPNVGPLQVENQEVTAMQE